MQIWKCDKCGKVLGENSCCKKYSHSKGSVVDLCRSCYNDHEKTIKKADEEFFKRSKK